MEAIMRIGLAATVLGLAAMSVSTAAAAQEGREGAAAFVRSVYASYGDDGPWPTDEARLDQVFSPRLAALIRRDRELADDDLPYLDADPICLCQDVEDIAVRSAGAGWTRGYQVMVAVRFVNGGEEKAITFLMAGNPNQGWRIDDIVDRDGASSLVEALEASNRRLEQGGRALHRD
jgi:hypothetical protein